MVLVGNRCSDRWEAKVTDRRRVALVLGSGGARGYAHIGVIHELTDAGYEIVGIAGTSMGALIGGLYAADHLDAYTDWVKSLSQRDVVRLLDLTLRGPGAVRADKILNKVTELVGATLIEDLRIPFTAVATDLASRKEIWFQRGRLDAAIRASIAIPGFITPVVMQGRLLADGGLVNPLPVVATASISADMTIAVSLSDEHLPTSVVPAAKSAGPGESDPESRFSDLIESARDNELVRIMKGWLRGLRGQLFDDLGSPDGEMPHEQLPAGLRTRDVLDLSLETMRSLIASYRLAGYPPDVLITIPHDACGSWDFHRAEEMITIGRERTRAMLASLAKTAR